MPSRAPLRRLACLLACLLLAGASGASPRRERAPKAASWEEVNVLAHGLLQLGHGLREHVERLGGQLRELSGRLGAHNASLAGLERSAAEQRERLARAQRLFDGRWAELDGRLRGLEGRLDGTGPAGAGNSSGNGPAAVTATAAEAEEEQGALQVRPGRRGRARRPRALCTRAEAAFVCREALPSPDARPVLPFRAESGPRRLGRGQPKGAPLLVPGALLPLAGRARPAVGCPGSAPPGFKPGSDSPPEGFPNRPNCSGKLCAGHNLCVKAPWGGGSAS